MIATIILIAALVAVAALVSGIAAYKEIYVGAVVSAFSSIGFLLILGLLVSIHGQQSHEDGMKDATIKCRTSECPYKLKTLADSTRIWTKR